MTRCNLAVCATLLWLLAAGCGRSPDPKGDEPARADQGTDGQAAKLGGEDEVVEFLASREMLRQMFRDPTATGSGTTLQPHFIDWVALGVSEPLEQRLALAIVMNTRRRQLKDKKYFEEQYPRIVRVHLDLGVMGGNIAKKLLREPDSAKALLTVADGDLASASRQKLIASVADEMSGKNFDAELAGFAAQALALVKKTTPPEFAEVQRTLRESLREALARHPNIAASLKRSIKIAGDVRESHERVGKRIRGAAGG
jgi:hypothetical protein